MRNFFSILTLCLGVALAPAAQAQSNNLAIIAPYARATVAGMTTGGVWFGVQNDGSESDRIVAVHTEIAGKTELHDMKMDGNIMRMFQIDGIDIPAGQTLMLGQGNKLHVMLLDLRQHLKEGDSFPLKIEFEKAGSMTVDVVVRAITHDKKGHH